ncbi:RIO1-domain-containing protein [Coccomyxa subellipsoidea C-169]|uniref:Serine/threonine-protein kinase RIO2 n=1 Tax=Coccomyxa subellipsoidea (strain C-169) TaxID=574566 RepID=I0YHZ4_COCSC|nr:RIO1-domain-containing protein [Coccomyxa subellipsoidea C-169]EIE18013.1 RIO1-domain-containing protein [Coccomyxa subellipsoidea C-169]|eukprot:XP_005642557.1 RIO1-domain-containing protein [Coccomyxa subellipsoidea C-169]
MKLDVNALRYLSRDESRTLQAVEIGQKNHDIVPVPLVDSIAGLKHGGVVRCLKALLRQKLVHHDNSRYDGYRLTPLGYDFLALKALVARGAITAVGRQIGVGKESDVFEACPLPGAAAVLNADGEVLAMKLHRLGRTSFRAVKKKRDYLQHRNSFSWLWLSRLAAAKEFAFMEALGAAGFPVPRAIEHNRHAVLMSLVDAVPLVQVKLADPGAVYLQLIDMIGDLASRGLVHCDFNEFNILVDEQGGVTLIDFPQMVSTSHANAEELFDRDIDCVIRFFNKKLGYVSEQDASLPYLRPDFKACPHSFSSFAGLVQSYVSSGSGLLVGVNSTPAGT